MPLPKKSQSKSVDVYGRALAEYQALGLSLPGKPEIDLPQLPEDLGEMADEELMAFFNELVQWANYVSTQVTRAEIRESDIEAQLRVVEAKYIVVNVGKGEAGIQRATKERALDPEVQRLSEELLQRKALRKMITTLFDNLERSASFASRELSRRIGMMGPQGRSAWTSR